KLSLALKDLRLVTGMAQNAGLQLPLAMAARAWFELSDSEGLGEFDYSAVTARARNRPVKG
ncbi:MAG: NAD-binding of NADP-dependent 3-hydroxyisobutyrate dehydrogenase, partial [Actinomycetota bacterium]|nr:NAD-binding of NADP-dependent 3-hydroxyisobutyrate dehydrogenase [Actinomycetota bacterium]